VPTPPTASKEDTRPTIEEFACSKAMESIYSKDRSVSCECSHAPKNQENELRLPIANRARAAHDRRQPCEAYKPLVFSSSGLGPSVCGSVSFAQMERGCVNCIEKTVIPISAAIEIIHRAAEARYLNMVGDLDKRNALVHPVVFTVEDHFPCHFACSCALAGNC
jgi:hypothetical protein